MEAGKMVEMTQNGKFRSIMLMGESGQAIEINLNMIIRNAQILAKKDKKEMQDSHLLGSVTSKMALMLTLVDYLYAENSQLIERISQLEKNVAK